MIIWGGGAVNLKVDQLLHVWVGFNGILDSSSSHKTAFFVLFLFLFLLLLSPSSSSVPCGKRDEFWLGCLA